jgi:hypothetical protein
MINQIHTTIGVYANGDFKINGVKAENLKEHIEYNKTMRFGRSLFVDGKCVHKGNLDDEQIKFYEKLFRSDSKYTRREDSAPYQ